mgnify:CR=1 FL=1
MLTVDTKLLRKEMIDKNINSASQLSEAAGVSYKTIIGILNGKVFPSSQVMSKIAGALKLNAATAGEIFFASKLTQ